MSRRPLAALVLVSALAGCGPTSPQAPLAEAKKLESATSGISTICGESYRLTAFPGDHVGDIAKLEAGAASSARELGSVYRRNSEWIYQGETVARIVEDGRSMLRDCNLPGAARVLERSTRSG
jgi:hypothetical protein